MDAYIAKLSNLFRQWEDIEKQINAIIGEIAGSKEKAIKESEDPKPAKRKYTKRSKPEGKKSHWRNYKCSDCGTEMKSILSPLDVVCPKCSSINMKKL